MRTLLLALAVLVLVAVCAQRAHGYWTQPGPALPMIEAPWLRGLPRPRFRVTVPWREPAEEPAIEDGEDELGFPPWLWSGPERLIVGRKLKIDNLGIA